MPIEAKIHQYIDKEKIWNILMMGYITVKSARFTKNME
jgi:hypothetical protein